MFSVFAVNSIIVTIAVMIHYESLYYITRLLKVMKIAPRYKIVVGVLGALLAHLAEVWIFAFGYYGMHHDDGWGHLEGNFGGSLLDCVYFSSTTFTTLGFGDIEPIGDLRFLTGVESLTGLVLITWTASFLYLEMQSYWESN